MTPKILTMTEEAAAEYTTVCSGWGLTHPEIVLVQGKPGAPKSHGMCERCKLFMNAQMDCPPAGTQALEQYRAYLESPIDPRD